MQSRMMHQKWFCSCYWHYSWQKEDEGSAVMVAFWIEKNRKKKCKARMSEVLLCWFVLSKCACPRQKMMAKNSAMWEWYKYGSWDAFGENMYFLPSIQATWHGLLVLLVMAAKCVHNDRKKYCIMLLFLWGTRHGCGMYGVVWWHCTFLPTQAS